MTPQEKHDLRNALIKLELSLELHLENELSQELAEEAQKSIEVWQSWVTKLRSCD